jgi:aerobic-type carbon monoxide dehydrogenase small subunit (CoxS/CutS family)
MNIEFRLNGRPVQLDVDGDRHLLWVLRTDFALTGTKYGCGASHCGACTALVNGRAVRTCTLPMRKVAGKDVVTIEGLASDGKLQPIQQAFVEHGALQCGFCTSGMILSAHALLTTHPHPTRQQIIEGMDNNLCRCGAHRRIIRAIEAASARMAGVP